MEHRYQSQIRASTHHKTNSICGLSCWMKGIALHKKRAQQKSSAEHACNQHKKAIIPKPDHLMRIVKISLFWEGCAAHGAADAERQPDAQKAQESRVI